MPAFTRRAAAADVGSPKNGDVSTPLNRCGLTAFRTLVARAKISRRGVLAAPRPPRCPCPWFCPPPPPPPWGPPPCSDRAGSTAAPRLRPRPHVSVTSRFVFDAPRPVLRPRPPGRSLLSPSLF